MTYIEQLLTMTYQECIDSLLDKYGNVNGDYFNDINCTKPNGKIKKGKEGLFVHHIDEDKTIMLSTREYAIKNPFEYQKANRLVYCNLLEHLVLHIKIVEYPNPKQNKNELCGFGGIANFIVPELNDIYSGILYKQLWKQKVVENVIPLKDDYFLCIKKLVQMNFQGKLLTSLVYNILIGWNANKNKNIFKELKELGVKH